MSYRPSYSPRPTPTGKRPLTAYISDQLFAELDIRAKQAKLSRAEYAALILSHHIGMPSKASMSLSRPDAMPAQGTAQGTSSTNIEQFGASQSQAAQRTTPS